MASSNDEMIEKLEYDKQCLFIEHNNKIQELEISYNKYIQELLQKKAELHSSLNQLYYQRLNKINNEIIYLSTGKIQSESITRMSSNINVNFNVNSINSSSNNYLLTNPININVSHAPLNSNDNSQSQSRATSLQSSIQSVGRSLSVQPDHEANDNELRYRHYQLLRNKLGNSHETSSVSSDEPISSFDSNSVSPSSSSSSDQDMDKDGDIEKDRDSDTFSDDEDLIIHDEDETDIEHTPSHDRMLGKRILRNAENTITSPPPHMIHQPLLIHSDSQQDKDEVPSPSNTDMAMDVDGSDDNANGNDAEKEDKIENENMSDPVPVQDDAKSVSDASEEHKEQSLDHLHKFPSFII